MKGCIIWSPSPIQPNECSSFPAVPVAVWAALKLVCICQHLQLHYSNQHPGKAACNDFSALVLNTGIHCPPASAILHFVSHIFVLLANHLKCSYACTSPITAPFFPDLHQKQAICFQNAHISVTSFLFDRYKKQTGSVWYLHSKCQRQNVTHSTTCSWYPWAPALQIKDLAALFPIPAATQQVARFLQVTLQSAASHWFLCPGSTLEQVTHPPDPKLSKFVHSVKFHLRWLQRANTWCSRANAASLLSPKHFSLDLNWPNVEAMEI